MIPKSVVRLALTDSAPACLVNAFDVDSSVLRVFVCVCLGGAALALSAHLAFIGQTPSDFMLH